MIEGTVEAIPCPKASPAHVRASPRLSDSQSERARGAYSSGDICDHSRSERDASPRAPRSCSGAKWERPSIASEASSGFCCSRPLTKPREIAPGPSGAIGVKPLVSSLVSPEVSSPQPPASPPLPSGRSPLVSRGLSPVVSRGIRASSLRVELAVHFDHGAGWGVLLEPVDLRLAGGAVGVVPGAAARGRAGCAATSLRSLQHAAPTRTEDLVHFRGRVFRTVHRILEQ